VRTTGTFGAAVGGVPPVEADDRWSVRVVADDAYAARCGESVLALGARGITMRGSHEIPWPTEEPGLLAAGVYTGEGSDTTPLIGPYPFRVAGEPGRSTATLDLASGLLFRESEGSPALRSVRFASAAREGVFVERVQGDETTPVFEPLPGAAPGVLAGESWARSGSGRGGLVVATHDNRYAGPVHAAERIVGVAADGRRPPPLARAQRRLAEAVSAGFDGLLAEQRATWAQRWEAVNVELPDDPSAELALRYALSQLWSIAPDHGEAAVGARGTTGTGYRGHVFWDADVFVLPALLTVMPQAARAMLTYRQARLGQARALARRRGLSGARIPWESAREGDDVTPAFGWINGQWAPVFTGELEEHIVADVAWAAQRYADWTGDERYLRGPDSLVLDGARYWQSRVGWDADGSAHLRHVIGPDEYHEDVDDNAYTNLLAQWHLRLAAELTADPAERETWQRTADHLTVTRLPGGKGYEQFAGYARLRPLLARDVAEPPFSADLLLGSYPTQQSQLIKQNDVLMAHHLLDDQLDREDLLADLDHYVPRTAHGSSLSPAITAAVLARAGRPEDALPLLDLALRLDLDDVSGMTPAGLHVATLAGCWQALLFGFLGVRVGGSGELRVDPHLPRRWRSVSVRFQCRGGTVALRVQGDEMQVQTTHGLVVHGSRGGAEASGEVVLRRRDGCWEVAS
jgi:trehalose/maltose hydrolase-like predicted phosphorylase